MQWANKQKRSNEYVYELQDVPEGEVEDTSEGDNDEIEDNIAAQAKTNAETSNVDPTDGNPIILENQKWSKLRAVG